MTEWEWLIEKERNKLWTSGRTFRFREDTAVLIETYNLTNEEGKFSCCGIKKKHVIIKSIDEKYIAIGKEVILKHS